MDDRKKLPLRNETFDVVLDEAEKLKAVLEEIADANIDHGEPEIWLTGIQDIARAGLAASWEGI